MFGHNANEAMQVANWIQLAEKADLEELLPILT